VLFVYDILVLLVILFIVDTFNGGMCGDFFVVYTGLLVDFQLSDILRSLFVLGRVDPCVARPYFG